jgi:hypothetical protein
VLVPFHRTASPPEPPADWLVRLQDYAQVRNLLAGDTVLVTDEMPAASILLEFLADPSVVETWERFRRERQGR